MNELLVKIRELVKDYGFVEIELKREEKTLNENKYFIKGSLLPVTFCINGIKVDSKGRKRATVLHNFGLAQMVGCCGVCISTGVYTWDKFRKKGINKVALEIRKLIAKDQGYGMLLCTYKANNEAEAKTLANGKFENIYEFNNPRTCNDIRLAAYTL